MEINKALKILREYHGLKQFEAADKIGFSRSVISELESGGRPASLDVIQRYADAFKIPASSVLLLAELSEHSLESSDLKGITRMKRNIAVKTFKILDWINEKTKVIST